MKRYIILYLTSILILPLSCKKQDTALSTLTVHSFFGSVSISAPSGTRIPEAGMKLREKDSIITANDSIAEILYKGKGVIRVNENSKLDISTILSKSGKEKISMNLYKGKVLVSVSKLAKGDVIKVKSSTTVAAVRGTTFRVSADKKTSRIDVLKGEVQVKPVSNGKEIEKAATIVEENKSVKVDALTVKKAVAGKKPLKIVALKEAEIEEITKEIKEIRAVEKLDPETQKEVKSIIEKAGEPEKKVSENKQAAKAAKKAAQAKKDAMKAAKAEKEKMAALKKKKTAEMAAKAKKAEKLRKKKERGVKNIPNL